jgi:hypothetical protein
MSEKSPDPVDRESPICLAVIICNDIIVDSRTNNKTLVSCFNGVAVNALPAMHPRLFILASITNIFSDAEIVISGRDPNYNELMQFRAKIAGSDPLAVHDLLVEVQNFALPSAGTYFFDILHNEKLLAERRMLVQVVRQTNIAPA